MVPREKEAALGKIGTNQTVGGEARMDQLPLFEPVPLLPL
jgi:hypothetical protein